MLKQGEVVAVFKERQTVKVRLSEEDNKTSRELFVLSHGINNSWLPMLGDVVSCHIDLNGNGVVLGTYPSAEKE